MGLIGRACRYPLATGDARDTLAVGTGLVLATLVGLRIARGLWPDALGFAALVLAGIPAVLFAGQLGSVIRADAERPEPPGLSPSALPFRTGFRLVAITGMYLLGPTVVLLGYVVALQNAGEELGQAGVAVAGTGAMVIALGLAYLLPGALVAATREGVRAGLRVRSLPGVTSGAYFVAWAGAAVLVVLGWGALRAAGTGTALAVVAAVWFAYTHLAAARLVREGVGRATGRPRGR
jgi:hypothetical protein